MRSAAFSVLALLLSACAVESADNVDETSAEATKTTTAKLSFTSAWTVNASRALAFGDKVQVAYDAARVTQCTGDFNGKPAWSQTGYWQVGSGPVSTFEAGGFSPSSGTAKPIFSLPAAVVRGEGSTTGDLTVWFQTTNRWGCTAYDSNLGQNYHFAIHPPANAPDWMGTARVVTSRNTCNDGRACDADRKPLGDGFVYGTWTAQRALIREASIEVYRAGVTDHADPELWKKLDVRAYTRVAGTSKFATQYLFFDGNVGNNARYTLQLRPLQPFAGNTVQNVKDCPAFPFHHTSDGYVEADVEIYFWVNGVELRGADGAPFKGTYQDYEGIYALCK